MDNYTAKICSRPDCPFKGLSQPLANFSKRKDMKDGYRSQCRACDKIARDKYYSTEHGKAIRKAGNDRNNRIPTCKPPKRTPEYTKARKIKYEHDYRATPTGREIKRKNAALDRQRHPERYQAIKAVRSAIYRGDIIHPRFLVCVDCGVPAKEYHHHKGYTPEHYLDVIPLCKQCHVVRHFPRR